MLPDFCSLKYTLHDIGHPVSMVLVVSLLKPESSRLIRCIKTAEGGRMTEEVEKAIFDHDLHVNRTASQKKETVETRKRKHNCLKDVFLSNVVLIYYFL